MRQDSTVTFGKDVKTVFDARFWYLAQLKPGGFERAVVNLQRQGFSTLMPVRDTSTRRNGKLATSRKPLFPGYLFTQVAPGRQSWRVINSTYGVARLVSLSGSEPTPVPDGIMATLQVRMDENGVFGAPEDLKPGDTVRIIVGPFAQQLAIIETVEPGDRVFILMDLMGRAARLQASAIQLETL
jgi:transcriptional antiterminator RfaH